MGQNNYKCHGLQLAWEWSRNYYFFKFIVQFLIAEYGQEVETNEMHNNKYIPRRE